MGNRIERGYWLDLFTGKTWEEFLKAGAEVSGFREGRWATVQKLKVGDYLLCYLTGISRFVGVLEVTSEPYKDSTRIWGDEEFPCRLKVKPLIVLSPLTAVPVQALRDKLSFLQNLKSPNAWSGNFRGSPARWSADDGEAIVSAIRDAKEEPIERPFDEAKFLRRPKTVQTKSGAVVIPEPDEGATEKASNSSHTEIQYELLKLGSDLGLDVWVARNDKSRLQEYSKGKLIERLRDELPIQFDRATNGTIELIDVLWLRRNAIVAAFEIESTTRIFTGLLRMADLISMQPNLNIPLFIVAPEERKNRVDQEINRPTFHNLPVPLSQICRFISFESLRETLGKLGKMTQHLKPDVINEISESCELDEA